MSITMAAAMLAFNFRTILSLALKACVNMSMAETI